MYTPHPPAVLHDFQELTAPVRRGRSVLLSADSGVVPVVVRALPCGQGLLSKMEYRLLRGDGPALQRQTVLLAEGVDYRDFAGVHRPGRGRAWERATECPAEPGWQCLMMLSGFTRTDGVLMEGHTPNAERMVMPAVELAVHWRRPVAVFNGFLEDGLLEFSLPSLHPPYDTDKRGTAEKVYSPVQQPGRPGGGSVRRQRGCGSAGPVPVVRRAVSGLSRDGPPAGNES